MDIYDSKKKPSHTRPYSHSFLSSTPCILYGRIHCRIYGCIYGHIYSHIYGSIFNMYTRSVRKVSALPLYLHAIVFERPLRVMNVNSKASGTYKLFADICRTYSSCATCLCLQSYFWVRMILWLLKMTEKQDQRICIKFCFQLGKTSSETIQMMQKAFGLWEWVYEQNTNKRVV